MLRNWEIATDAVSRFCLRAKGEALWENLDNCSLDYWMVRANRGLKNCCDYGAGVRYDTREARLKGETMKVIGLFVGFGMVVLNLDALVIYAEIKQDSLVSAGMLLLVIPVVIGLIGAAIADIATSRVAEFVGKQDVGLGPAKGPDSGQTL